MERIHPIDGIDQIASRCGQQPERGSMGGRHGGTYCVIDVETTGVRGCDTIVEFACLTMDVGGTVLQSYDTLIDPQRDPGPTWLHGITRQMCDGAPTFAEVAGTIHDLLVGNILIAHRLHFDWRMIRRNFDRLGISFLREAQGVCTANLAREAGIEGGLQRIAHVLELKVGSPHQALEDAQTTRELWLQLRTTGHLDRGQPLLPASGAHRLTRLHPGRSRSGEPRAMRPRPAR
jgi:DNA polymerase-3 subunit epsilon